MARPLRVQFPGAYYHVMNRGLQRRPVFLGAADHHRFLDLLQDIHGRWQVEVFAYCCMTTHYHLFLQTPLGNLARVMRHLDGLYTQGFNRAHGRDGPLFRGRYKSLLVDADAYLLQIVRYIHLNPVEAGLAADPLTYHWSSHRLYHQHQTPAWLASERILAFFDDLPAFDQFIAEGNGRSLSVFYQRKRWTPFLGDEQFVRRALEQTRVSPENPRAERTPQFPTIDAVVRFVCQRTATPLDAIQIGYRGRRNVPRSLAVFLSSRVAGFPHREICEYFHFETCGAVTRVCQRTEGLLSADPDLRHLISPDGDASRDRGPGLCYVKT